MKWNKEVHSGWRRGLGIFLIVFGLVNAGLYYNETRLVASANQVIATQIPTVAASAAASEHATHEATPEATQSPVPVGKIRITTATSSELESLPGIGPAKAKAIIEFRETKGFKTVQDLEKVKGIGPKTMERLEPLIEL